MGDDHGVSKMLDQSTRPVLQRYGLATLVSVVAFSVAVLIHTWVEANFFPLFLVAVTVSVWYGGLGPGLWSILVTVVSTFCLFFFFLDPHYVLDLREVLGRLSLFVPAALLIGWLMAAHKRTEKALKEERDFVSAVLQTAGSLVVVTDTQGRLVRFNRACEETTGYSFDEVRGRSVWELFLLPEEVEPVKAVLAALAAGQLRNEYENVWKTRDGRRRLIAWSNTAIRGSGGSVEYVISTGTDITERKQAEIERAQLIHEQAARAAAERITDRVRRLQVITDAALAHLSSDDLPRELLDRICDVLAIDTAAILVLAPEGDALVVRATRGLAAELEPGSRIPVGPVAARSRPADCGAANIEGLDNADGLSSMFRVKGVQASLGVSLVIEGRLIGAIYVGTLLPRHFTQEDNQLLQLVADRVALAIDRAHLYEAERTARAEAEAAQRTLAFVAEAGTVLAGSLDYEATLQSVVQLAVPVVADWCAVDLIEEDGSLRRAALAHADPAKLELARRLQPGFPFDPGAPYSRAKVLRSGQSELISTIPDTLLASSSSDDAAQRELLRSLQPGSIIIVPLAARGHILGTMAYGVAESARRYGPADVVLSEEIARRAALAIDNAGLYHEAQEAVHARDIFLSIASHELKTPLATVKGYAELLLCRQSAEASTNERDRRALQTIYEQAVRLHKLIELLLNVSGVQTGQLSIESRPVDLGALARRLVERMRPTLVQHTLELTSSEEPLVVAGDEFRLEQVLQNLIDNAIKYSPRGGPVSVRLERRGGQIAIDVCDRGLGIPAEALPELFKRFYRVNRSEGQQISGMGLGLYVTKEVISLHGGTITVESEEGKGSIFTVRLPACAEE